MTIPVYTFQRGEPVPLALDLATGESGAGITCTAVLKPVSPGAVTVPDDSVASVDTFACSYVAAASPDPARFLLSLTALQTDALPEGRYMTDAKFVQAGVVIQRTEPAIIVLKGRVTP